MEVITTNFNVHNLFL